MPPYHKSPFNLKLGRYATSLICKFQHKIIRPLLQIWHKRQPVPLLSQSCAWLSPYGPYLYKVETSGWQSQCSCKRLHGAQHSPPSLGQHFEGSCQNFTHSQRIWTVFRLGQPSSLQQVVGYIIWIHLRVWRGSSCQQLPHEDPKRPLGRREQNAQMRKTEFNTNGHLDLRRMINRAGEMYYPGVFYLISQHPSPLAIKLASQIVP